MWPVSLTRVLVAVPWMATCEADPPAPTCMTIAPVPENVVVRPVLMEMRAASVVDLDTTLIVPLLVTPAVALKTRAAMAVTPVTSPLVVMLIVPVLELDREAEALLIVKLLDWATEVASRSRRMFNVPEFAKEEVPAKVMPQGLLAVVGAWTV